MAGVWQLINGAAACRAGLKLQTQQPSYGIINIAEEDPAKRMAKFAEVYWSRNNTYESTTTLKIPTVDSFLMDAQASGLLPVSLLDLTVDVDTAACFELPGWTSDLHVRCLQSILWQTELVLNVSTTEIVDDKLFGQTQPPSKDRAASSAVSIDGQLLGLVPSNQSGLFRFFLTPVGVPAYPSPLMFDPYQAPPVSRHQLQILTTGVARASYATYTRPIVQSSTTLSVCYYSSSGCDGPLFDDQFLALSAKFCQPIRVNMCSYLQVQTLGAAEAQGAANISLAQVLLVRPGSLDDRDNFTVQGFATMDDCSQAVVAATSFAPQDTVYSVKIGGCTATNGQGLHIKLKRPCTQGLPANLRRSTGITYANCDYVRQDFPGASCYAVCGPGYVGKLDEEAW